MADRHLDAFQQEHQAPRGRLARAIKSCRFLLREAGRREVSAQTFEADLDRLSDRPGELTAIIMPGFDRAMVAVKQEILYGTLTDHGKLLVGVDWRVDSMLNSHRGQSVPSPVTMVTLRYVEGD